MLRPAVLASEVSGEAPLSFDAAAMPILFTFTRGEVPISCRQVYPGSHAAYNFSPDRQWRRRKKALCFWNGWVVIEFSAFSFQATANLAANFFLAIGRRCWHSIMPERVNVGQLPWLRRANLRCWRVISVVIRGCCVSSFVTRTARLCSLVRKTKIFFAKDGRRCGPLSSSRRCLPSLCSYRSPFSCYPRRSLSKIFYTFNFG